MKKKIGPGVMYARLKSSEFQSDLFKVNRIGYAEGHKNRIFGRMSFSLDQIICDYQAHDFIGTLINLAYFGVSHMPFHWIFLTIPITP